MNVAGLNKLNFDCMAGVFGNSTKPSINRNEIFSLKSKHFCNSKSFM